jgi:hypothetical protein
MWQSLFKHLRTLAYILPLALCTSPLNVHALSVEVEDNNNRKILFYDHSRALLIGQSTFGKGWNELSRVPADLEELQKSFVAQGFDEVKVVQNLEGRDILPTIEEFISKDTGPATRTIVYLTGHGWTSPTGVTFLVGHDADLPGPDSPPQIARMLPVTALKELNKTSHALHTLLILDSCYSGAALETKSAVAPTRLLAEQMRKPVFQMLASGQKDQRVSSDGVFAELFIAGMAGAAAKDQDHEFVTFRQLAYWLVFELPKRSNQVPVYMDYPAPNGDMVFLTPKEDLGKPRPAGKHVVSLASQADAEKHAAVAQSGTFRAQFPKTTVYYYRKASDDLSVVASMNKSGVDYIARPAELPDSMKTNSLGCGPTTSLDALKTLARSLIQDGVPIARVAPYRDPNAKGGRIEVLSSANGVDPKTKQYTQNLKPLSLSEIDAIKTCRTTESKHGGQ